MHLCAFYKDRSCFTSDVFENHASHFQPCMVKGTLVPEQVKSLCTQLLASMSNSDARTDVSCNSLRNEDFIGDPEHRETVQIKFKDLAEAFLCQRTGERHWLHSTELQLYLSQCCVLAKEHQLIQLDNLEFDLSQMLPTPLEIKDIETANIWINLCPAKSRLHYDANHNLLFVLEGRKELWLIPPDLTRFVNPVSCFVDTPNHCCMSVDDVLSKLVGLEREGKCTLVEVGPSSIGDDINVCATSPRVFHFQCIQAGDMIFIPEGWWHQVISDDGTFAVNIWFASALAALFASNQHMREYILRSIPYHINQTIVNNEFSQKTRHPGGGRDLKGLVQSFLCMGCDSQNRDDLCETIFIAYPFQAETEQWLKFAREHQELFKQLLQKLPPKSAARLLHQWDILDQDISGTNLSTFEDIFGCLGEDGSKIRNSLIAQRKLYMQEEGERFVRETLG